MALIKTEFLKYKGFLYTKENISILTQFLTVTKENVKLTDEQKASVSNIVVDYLVKVGNLKHYPLTDKKILIRNYFNSSTNQPFYKYISKQIYNDYASKGCFRLGSIKYYQAVENNKIKDEYEGFTNLFIDYKNRQLMVTLFSGYNFAIFCGTSNFNLISNKFETMNNKFGEVIMKINDIDSFANSIKEIIGAKSYYCYEVKYSTKKVFSIDQSDIYFNPTMKDKFEITPNLFDLFYNNSFFPSLFIKPEFFGDGNEIRIAFEMQSDVNGTIDIENKELLKHIEFINVNAL